MLPPWPLLLAPGLACLGYWVSSSASSFKLTTSPDPVGYHSNLPQTWLVLASEKPQEFPLTARLTPLRDLLETGVAGGRETAGYVPYIKENLQPREKDLVTFFKSYLK